ncbi:formate dehydrogenase-N subunit alpha [Paraburkholderia pallida]|uniref:Formate dehydrogenase-N subunit alpha n=3 Tax=Paraburkholderia pallida TaxID=2547399 RepID=A0A4P7D4M8_9BURK|nr:formate dehydrogenase-N subunit alpha [Paraburkholderia pallida]
MTNHWVDIKNADVILVMGGNSAEAHPCGFKWVVEAKAHRGAKLIVVDPRFNRTASVADLYAPIRTGTDIAFLGGVIRYLLSNDKIQHEYVKNYTDFTFIVRDDFAFSNGLYSGYDSQTRSYDKSTWEYEFDADGYVKSDPSLRHPRCVYQLLKAHYSSYTPEMVESICGTPKEKFLQVCEMLATTSSPGKAGTLLYALGWTQHSIGSQIVRTGAMVQLLLGNIGIAGGGVNALRGHSNIQGLTDLGLLSQMLPGYLTLPNESEQEYQKYASSRTLKPLRPNQLSYYQHFPALFVSLMKAWWGQAATAENDWAYSYLPKWDKPYDVLQVVELMSQGKMTGYVCQGFNLIASVPDKAKIIDGLGKLKWLVIMDPLATETSEFWKNYGPFNDVDPSSIQTEVFRLPTNCFAEENGSVVSSSRVLQWHWKGAEPPGEARSDLDIMGGIFTRIRDLYRKKGGAFPDPILNLTWPYEDPESPRPDELAREYNGWEVKAASDYDTKKLVETAGRQLSGFEQLRDDGSTASGCWIFCGAWTEEGNQMGRRDNSDPTGIGQTLGWAWAWPANRRVLYNRASCDTDGKPFDPTRKLVQWNGSAWVGDDVPDYKVDEAPSLGMGPFVLNPEGVARFFARNEMNEGPFPVHYEPIETPLGYNPLYPDHPNVTNNPVARIFPSDRKKIGNARDFPHTATTYRLTEHFHFWTKHARLNAILQPEQFVEISEELAHSIGVVSGDRVKVSSFRGHIVAVAVVTKRIRTLTIEGKHVQTVGIPLHWGFKGAAKPGYLTNTLTPSVGDGNTQTPEFKSFLVKVEKA